MVNTITISMPVQLVNETTAYLQKNPKIPNRSALIQIAVLAYISPKNTIEDKNLQQTDHSREAPPRDSPRVVDNPPETGGYQ